MNICGCNKITKFAVVACYSEGCEAGKCRIGFNMHMGAFTVTHYSSPLMVLPSLSLTDYL